MRLPAWASRFFRAAKSLSSHTLPTKAQRAPRRRRALASASLVWARPIFYHEPMNDEWKALLAAEGARFDGPRVIDFGDPIAEIAAAAQGSIRCDLSHYGLIRVTGDDAVSFLQGQLTANIREVGPERSRLAAWCNAKGRMLSTMRVLQLDDGLLLRLPLGRLEPVLRRLRMYVLRARVELEDASSEYARIGLSGDAIPGLLEQQALALPALVDAVVQADDFAIVRVPGLYPRLELVGTVNALATQWRHLRTIPAAGADAWGMLETMAGLPEVLEQTVEAFVPQMVNLELLGGVSFTKGCYPGQEVVARTQHLGKLKRRMHLARLGPGPRPAPNARVCAVDDGADQGRLVAAYPDGSGGWLVLAVVQSAAVLGRALTVEGHPDQRLTFEPLPYPVPSADESAQ